MSTLDSDFPSPYELGAPPHFAEWRGAQTMAFARALESDRRFIVLALPTGVGKSLLPVCYSLLTGDSMLYLTSTKGLQDQLARDFADTGLRDVRGMANYPCRELDNLESCDRGPCLDGHKCIFLSGGCLYFDAVKTAAQAKLRSSNYSWWFSNRRPNVMRDLELLVCDEAHEIADELSSALRIELTEPEINMPRADMPFSDWVVWAGRALPVQEARLERTRPGYARRKLKDLVNRLTRLSEASGEWVVERMSRGMAFEPLWPAPYAEEWLWRGAGKVILMSATIRPQTLKYLGLTPADYEFIECPSPFPISSRPIYHFPLGFKLSYETPDEDWLEWVRRIDQIIEDRLDRKGIVHTVSYKRAQFLLEHSEYAQFMLVHETRTTQRVVQEFKDAQAPAILVSPSVTTGYDFPMEQCEYQILGKVPFPNFHDDDVGKARRKADDDYYMWTTSLDIVQAVGRGVRQAGDRCETFLLDDAFGWVVWRNRHLYPQWMLDAYRKVETLPRPLDKLEVA